MTKIIIKIIISFGIIIICLIILLFWLLSLFISIAILRGEMSNTNVFDYLWFIPSIGLPMVYLVSDIYSKLPEPFD